KGPDGVRHSTPPDVTAPPPILTPLTRVPSGPGSVALKLAGGVASAFMRVRLASPAPNSRTNEHDGDGDQKAAHPSELKFKPGHFLGTAGGNSKALNASRDPPGQSAGREIIPPFRPVRPIYNG